MIQHVTFPTSSPFVLRDAVESGSGQRMIEGRGFLHEPAVSDAAQRLPAVVVLEGLGGLKARRECSYGAQLAEWGYIALVVDSFGARGAAEDSHNKRALNITESMMIADAFGALRFLADHPRVDPARIAVVGFSYGGMISTVVAHRQVNELFAADGPRFAGHVSYYGCSVPRFDRVETTGAPVLMLLGELDRNVAVPRSRDIAADLRRGGSPVAIRVYPGVYHQWDGPDRELRHIKYSLIKMRLRVRPDFTIRDERTGLIMRGPISRRLILAAGVSRSSSDESRLDLLGRNVRAFREIVAALVPAAMESAKPRSFKRPAAWGIAASMSWGFTATTSASKLCPDRASAEATTSTPSGTFGPAGSITVTVTPSSFAHWASKAPPMFPQPTIRTECDTRPPSLCAASRMRRSGHKKQRRRRIRRRDAAQHLVHEAFHINSTAEARMRRGANVTERS